MAGGRNNFAINTNTTQERAAFGRMDIDIVVECDIKILLAWFHILLERRDCRYLIFKHDQLDALLFHFLH
jgi:hypothetical protein